MSNEIRIARLAYGGDGIGTLESGKTVFVKGAVPGDTVLVETVSEHQRHDNAVVVEVVEASPDRVSAPCPYHRECGGCPWQMIGYEAQLKWKRQFVVDAIERIGKISDAEALVAPCVESKRQWNHRNKIELVPVVADGKLQLGYHAMASDRVIPVERCLLLSKRLEKAPKALAGALRYLKADEHGLERVELRHSRRTGSVQVALWTRPDAFPRKAAADILAGAINYTSLVRVLVKDMKSRKIAGVETLAGEEHWRETLGDFEMAVSAPSFFQVNTAGADKLVKLALEGLQLKEDDICADLYCGAGTFTLPLAERCDLVYAVESYGTSVRDLRRNLFDNGLDAEVIGGDAVREARGIGKVDKLVIDPPYSGMSGNIFEGIESLSPRRIALVSCNPTTLARDLQGFVDLGFEVESVTPVDLFPQSYHVETVTILSRKPQSKRAVAAAAAKTAGTDGEDARGARPDAPRKGSHGDKRGRGSKEGRSGYGEARKDGRGADGFRKGGRSDADRARGDGHARGNARGRDAVGSMRENGGGTRGRSRGDRESGNGTRGRAYGDKGRGGTRDRSHRGEGPGGAKGARGSKGRGSGPKGKRGEG